MIADVTKVLRYRHFQDLYGLIDILCTNDRDFFDPAVLSFCATRGIQVCSEVELMRRLTGS
jgi:hypothetical protein